MSLALNIRLGLQNNGVSGGYAPVPFDPLSGAPKLWLDASDTATISDTGTLTFADKSGYDYNATQPTAGSKPASGTRTINGLNVLDFDGVNDHLLLPSGLYGITNGPNTLMVVCALDNTSTQQRIFWGATATSGEIRYGLDVYSGGLQLLRANNSLLSNYAEKSGIGTSTDARLLTMYRNGTQIGVFHNGGVPATASTGINGTLTWLGIGSGGPTIAVPMNGVIGEILLFDRLLTNTEAENYGQYLKEKWNLLGFSSGFSGGFA